MYYFTVYLSSGCPAKLRNTVDLYFCIHFQTWFHLRGGKLFVIGYKTVTWERSGSAYIQMQVYKTQTIGTTGFYGPERALPSLYLVSMKMVSAYSKVSDNYTKSKTIIHHKCLCYHSAVQTVSQTHSSHPDLCIHSSGAAFQVGAAAGPCQAYHLMKERRWPTEQRRLRDWDSGIIMSPQDK